MKLHEKLFTNSFFSVYMYTERIDFDLTTGWLQSGFKSKLFPFSSLQHHNYVKTMVCVFAIQYVKIVVCGVSITQ